MCVFWKLENGRRFFIFCGMGWGGTCSCTWCYDALELHLCCHRGSGGDGVGSGWGGVGVGQWRSPVLAHILDATLDGFSLTCPLVVDAMNARRFFSCTCKCNYWMLCYARRFFFCTCTCTWGYASREFQRTDRLHVAPSAFIYIEESMKPGNIPHHSTEYHASQGSQGSQSGLPSLAIGAGRTNT